MKTEDKSQNQDQSKEETSPQMQQLMDLVKGQAEQIKTLTDKLAAQDAQAEEAKKKAEEAAKLAVREKNLDLEGLLLGLEEEQPSSEPAKKGKKKGSNIDELSNAELVGVIGDSLAKFLDARLEQFEEKTVKSSLDLAQKVEGTQSVLARMLAMSSITSLKSKYPDFDLFAEDVDKHVKSIPGISLEQAYKLAKAEKLERMPNALMMETELPDETPGPSGMRPLIPNRKRRSEADGLAPIDTARSGTAVFREFLSDGIDKALARRPH